MWIISCDPGVNGACGVLTSSGMFRDVFDLPTVIANKSTKSRQSINGYELANLLRPIVLEAGGNIVAVIENVRAMPRIAGSEKFGMGASSAFSFGAAFGEIKGVIKCLGVSLELVEPQTWKRHFALSRDKEQSRELAQRMFPGAPLGLKKHKDRAEALLIGAWYARTKMAPATADKPF